MDYRIMQIIMVERDRGDGVMENRTLYVPKEIKRGDIESIMPYYTLEGKLYKNVTLLESYRSSKYLAVGNYMEHRRRFIINKIGFK